MANSNYKECWWFVQAISGELGPASLIGSDWYSLETLADFYGPEFRQYFDMTDTKIKKTFSVKIWRLRIKLYYLFGIIVPCESFGNHKGNGGYFYYLANPEVLDDSGKTLREHIELLAKYETNIPTKLDFEEVYRKYQNATPSTSMGFISGPSNTSSRMILGEENLEYVLFAMKFGEVLTIKYGKVKAGIDINAPYSFEPYQLKEIEGRWFAIGNLYPLGHKESSELAIYDLERMELAYDENPDFKYEPDEDFEINDHITLDAACKRRLSCVRAIDILTHSEEFAGYISEHPLCSAQEAIKGGVRIYINLTVDLIVMLGAYGDEMSIGLPAKDGDEDIDRPIIRQALNYFRKTEER